MTEILTWQTMSAADWSSAAAALKQGELVLLPTDTVYGLAADPEAEGALEKIFQLKGRSPHKPVALAFGTVAQVAGFFPALPVEVQRALTALLPGPVTAVIPAGGEGWRRIGAPGGDSAGIRVIPGELSASLQLLPTPLALTSANISGGADPCGLAEVPSTVLTGCRFAIDAGRRQPCLPSTVVDLRPLAFGEPACILRRGAWDSARIASLIGAVRE